MDRRLWIALVAGIVVVTVAVAWGLRESGDATGVPAAIDALPRPAATHEPPHFDEHGAEAEPVLLATVEMDVAPAAASAASALGDSTLVVQVRYEADDSPVVGASLLVTWAPGSRPPLDLRTAETDGEGNATIVFAEEGSVWWVEVLTGVANKSKSEHANLELRPGDSKSLQVLVRRGAAVSGVVVDAQGTPLAQAEVLAWSRLRDSLESLLHQRDGKTLEDDPIHSPDARAVTDAAGRFTLRSLGPSVVLTARSVGLAGRWDLTGRVGESEHVDGLVLEMEPGGFISGRVIDDLSNPLADIWVTAKFGWVGEGSETDVAGIFRAYPSHRSTATAADGSFTLGPLIPGDWIVAASWKDWPPRSQRVEPGTSGVDIVLSPGLSLSGIVRGSSGQPLSSAHVELLGRERASATTGPDGRYEMQNLKVDFERVLGVIAEGHALTLVEDVAIRSDRDNVVDVQLGPEFILAGHVVNEHGEPVRSAVVEIRGDRPAPDGTSYGKTWEGVVGLDRTLLDEAGRFQFEFLYDGMFEITVTLLAGHDDKSGMRQMISARSGREDLLIRLDPDTMRGVELRGRVSDALTGAPVPSFDIRVTRFPQEAEGMREVDDSLQVRDGEGDYELVGLTPGPLELSFTADGFAPHLEPAREYPIGKHVLDVELLPGRTLDLRVLDTSGQPVPNARISVEDNRGEALRVRYGPSGWWKSSGPKTDDEGRARVSGLPADRVTVVVSLRHSGRSALPLGEVRFGFDLRVPLAGEQQVVVDMPHDRWLVLLVLVGDNPSAWQGADYADEQTLIRFREAMADGSLSSPQVTHRAVSREGNGTVFDTSTCTWSAEEGYSFRWGVEMHQSDRPSLSLRLPDGACEVEISADGYESVTLQVSADGALVNEVVVLQRTGGL